MFGAQLSNPLDAAAEFTVRWLRRDNFLWRVPVHANGGLLVVAYDEKVSAYIAHRLDDATGRTEWTRTLPVGGYGAPAVLDGRAAVLTDHVAVAILDWESGRTTSVWRDSSRIRSPVTVSGGHFVLSSGSNILRLAPNGVAENIKEVHGATLFGSVLPYESSWISLYARRRSSRQVLGVLSSGWYEWSADLTEGALASSDTSGPTLQDGTIYCGLGRQVVALDATDGRVLWRRHLRGIVTRSKPTCVDGRLFVGSMDGTLTALATDDGAILWEHHVGLDGIWTPVSALGDGVTVIGSGRLVSIGLGGEKRSTIPVGQSAYSALTFNSKGVGVLGGGDPPYHGLLMALKPVRCGDHGELEPAGIDRWRVQVSRQGEPTSASEIDASVFGAGLVPIEDDCTVQLSTGRLTHGAYALPVRLKDGSWITAHLDLGGWPDYPSRASLDHIVMPSIDLLHSGAAILASLLGKGAANSQRAVRAEAERIISQSESQPWDMWRLAARQILHSPPAVGDDQE